MTTEEVSAVTPGDPISVPVTPVSVPEIDYDKLAEKIAKMQSANATSVPPKKVRFRRTRELVAKPKWYIPIALVVAFVVGFALLANTINDSVRWKYALVGFVLALTVYAVYLFAKALAAEEASTVTETTEEAPASD